MEVGVEFAPKTDAMAQWDAPDSVLSVVDEARPEAVPLMLRRKEQLLSLVFGGEVS